MTGQTKQMALALTLIALFTEGAMVIADHSRSPAILMLQAADQSTADAACTDGWYYWPARPTGTSICEREHSGGFDTDVDEVWTITWRPTQGAICLAVDRPAWPRWMTP